MSYLGGPNHHHLLSLYWPILGCFETGSPACSALDHGWMGVEQRGNFTIIQVIDLYGIKGSIPAIGNTSKYYCRLIWFYCWSDRSRYNGQITWLPQIKWFSKMLDSNIPMIGLLSLAFCLSSLLEQCKTFWAPYLSTSQRYFLIFDRASSGWTDPLILSWIGLRPEFFY